MPITETIKDGIEAVKEIAEEAVTEVSEEPTEAEELEVSVDTEAIETDVVAIEEETKDLPHIKELDAETEVEIPPTEESTESEEAEVAEAEDEEQEVEEAVVEEVSEDNEEDEEDESEEDDPLAETLASLQKQIETLTNTVNELTEQNVALKKTNRKLSNKLQNEKSKKEAFIENVKGLSVALLPNEEKKETEAKKEKVNHSAYYNGDGIGEL